MKNFVPLLVFNQSRTGDREDQLDHNL
jgi:hypothetical protein